MLLSGVPTKLIEAFAVNGIKNTIPTTSQIGITPGAASLNDGFPPLTFVALANGGVPPFGADMNGILYLVSNWIVWLAAGSPIQYDSAFATAIGGYPKGAMILSADATHWWLNALDGNATNPDSGGTNWTKIGPFGNLMSLNAGAGLTISGNALNVNQAPGNACYAQQNFL